MSNQNLKTSQMSERTRSHVSVERAIELSKKSDTKWAEAPEATKAARQPESADREEELTLE